MKAARFPGFFGRAILVLVVLISSAPQGKALADIGWPPINPGGASLGMAEGEPTEVRMVEEAVDLTIEPTTYQVRGGFNMLGRVEAVFLMRNLGATDERLDVWFPLAASLRYSGMLPDYDPDNFIQNFNIWVGGQLKAYQVVKAPDVGDPTKESRWARFSITFPAGKDVTVRVAYTLFPSGREPFGGFEYILQTGAGWKDTIGKAVVLIHLPYPVTKENVSLAGNSLDSMPITPQPPGYIIDNDTIHWEFSDLEPGPQDNIFVEALEPARYQILLKARDHAAREPDSAEAQFALAKASAGALLVLKGVWQNGGGAELAEQARIAFRRAVELAPGQADIYIEYINWLLAAGGWGGLMFDGTCPPEACDLLDRALQLFPDNPDLLGINQSVRQMQTEGAFSKQYALDQTETESAKTQRAAIRASTATALAIASLPAITPPAPTTTKAAPRPTIVSAVTSRPLSPTAAATPTPPPALLPGGRVSAFWLPLALMVVIGLAGWLVWFSRRK